MTEATTSIAPFEITGWDEETYDEPAEGPRLTRARVTKRYRGGPLEGTSVAELLTAQGPGGDGYLASERFEGTLDGRAGTFVMQHGGIAVGDERRPFGSIVPGSGTGELAGLRGTVAFAHDEQGARVELTYEL
jgi:hypothetical protein